MAKSDTTTQVDTNAPDWHPADVLAALKKRGHCLAALSSGTASTLRRLGQR